MIFIPVLGVLYIIVYFQDFFNVIYAKNDCVMDFCKTFNLKCQFNFMSVQIYIKSDFKCKKMFTIIKLTFALSLSLLANTILLNIVILYLLLFIMLFHRQKQRSESNFTLINSCSLINQNVYSELDTKQDSISLFVQVNQ